MIYYDRFADEYVSKSEYEKNVNAPPERYLVYMKGTEGIYTEKYRLCDSWGYGDRCLSIDFSYSEFQMTNYPEVVAKDRRIFFEVNRLLDDRIALFAYIVPPSVYDKIKQQLK